jgi:hypothetical protein
LSPLGGQNVKQKACNRPVTFEPLFRAFYQGEFEKENAMRFGPWTAVLAVVLSLAAVSARAEDCPAKTMQMDDIIVALNEAPSCDRAMEIFAACEFGASGDVGLGAVVEKKCEGDFLSRLKAPQKRAYQDQLSRCIYKYRNQSGTMYRSFSAFCRAEISQRYSRRALKAAGPSKAR